MVNCLFFNRDIKLTTANTIPPAIIPVMPLSKINKILSDILPKYYPSQSSR
jgi:hypothetical protein